MSGSPISVLTKITGSTQGRFLRKNPGPVLPRLAEEPGSHDGQKLTRSCTLGIRGLGVSHTRQRPDRNTGR